MLTQIDITKVSEFARGEARYSRIASNAKTGVEAWRRSYTFAPMCDRVEIFVPQAGKYYPEENRITRRIPTDCKNLQEKMDFYLTNGVSVWYPGDEPKGITED